MLKEVPVPIEWKWGFWVWQAPCQEHKRRLPYAIAWVKVYRFYGKQEKPDTQKHIPEKPLQWNRAAVDTPGPGVSGRSFGRAFWGVEMFCVLTWVRWLHRCVQREKINELCPEMSSLNCLHAIC